MTGGNWGRATDSDSDLTSIAYTLQDLVQKQQKMEATWNAFKALHTLQEVH